MKIVHLEDFFAMEMPQNGVGLYKVKREHANQL